MKIRGSVISEKTKLISVQRNVKALPAFPTINFPPYFGLFIKIDALKWIQTIE